MGVMPVNKLLLSMAVPMMISMLVQALYNVVDSVFVSRISENALTAVSLAFPMQNLLISFAVGFGVGINALMSRALGEKDPAHASRIAVSGMVLEAGSYVLFLIIGLFFTETFMRAQISAEVPAEDAAEIIAHGVSYLRIVLIFSFGVFAEITYERILQSTGRTTLSMITQLIGAILNIIFDPILIFGYLGFPKMGIAGAAWATVLAQLLSAAASLVYLRLRHPLLLFRRADMVIDRALLSRTVRFGAVAALHQSSVYIGKLLVQGAVNTLGAEAINAYTAATRIEGFANSFGDSGAAAEAVFIGQNVGGERPDRVRRGFFTGLRLMVGLGLAMAAVMFIWAEPLSRLVLPDSNAAELAESVRYLRLVSLFYVLCFIGSLFVGYFEGIGRISIPTIGSAAHLSLRVVLAWLLVGRMGLAGVALATGLGWCLVVSFQLGVYRGVILRRRHA